MTCICHQTTGVQLANYHLTEWKYADDITMFSNTITDLKAGFNVFKEEASKLGLQVARRKLS